MEFDRVKQLFRYDFLTKDEAMANPWIGLALVDCLGMYDWAMAVKFSLNKGVRRSLLYKLLFRFTVVSVELYFLRK